MKPDLSELKRAIHTNDPEFLADVCWALYDLCDDGSEENIQSFIDAGLVPRLVQLLQNPSPFVIEPALGIVKSIASGNNQQTQIVIDCGALPLLAYLLTQNHQVDYDYNKIKKDACWTISFITGGTEEQIQAVIGANLIPMLVHLTQNYEFDIKKVAVWAISDAAVGGSHDQIKYMVEQSCIKPLCDLLECSDEKIISVCLDGLENILKAGEAEKKNSSGEVNYYRQLIDDAGWLQKIENLQFLDEHFEIARTAFKMLERYWHGKEDDDEMQQPPK